MDLDDAIARRRAVRDYTTEPVDEPTIRHLIAAAVQAPSAVNEQPWTFAVVRDQRLLDRLSEESKRHLFATAPPGEAPERLHALLDDPGFQIFHHAPVLVLVSATTAGPWIVEDCALAAENLMLAACAAGLGSCWIGLATGFLATPAGKELLGLPPECVPVAPIIVGHPAHAVPAVPRKAPEVRWIDPHP
jgi:nitroreductase